MKLPFDLKIPNLTLNVLFYIYIFRKIGSGDFLFYQLHAKNTLLIGITIDVILIPMRTALTSAGYPLS